MGALTKFLYLSRELLSHGGLVCTVGESTYEYSSGMETE